MATCILYHGPGALRQALSKAEQIGPLAAPPFGEPRLTTEDARKMVSLLRSPMVGGVVGVVIAGPMDVATVKAGDVLLKVIEEFDETVVWPLLWADDLGTVSLTIRSRCRGVWCPPGEEEEEDEELMSAGFDLVDASLRGDLYRIPGLVRQFSPKKKEKKKNRTKELLEAAIEALASQPDARHLALWERVRPVTLYWNPTALDVIAAFLPETP